MSDINNSKYHDEREAILDVMRDNDKEAWDRFQTCKLFMLHQSHNMLILILENHLERAGRLQFEGDWDEAKAAQIDVYFTIYCVVGNEDDIAREKAEELAEESTLRGLRSLF